MKTKTEKMLCWKHFQCSRKSCPAYKNNDALCWLISGTNCSDTKQGGWLEKMEVCLNCEVFHQNIQKEDLVETLRLVSEQFVSYRKKIELEQHALNEAQKKLQQFKTTSIYLLKELDTKSDELAYERNTLEERVQQKTVELEAAYSKLMHTSKMAVIGRFASGIAHEINNPLGAIINYVRNLTANPELSGKSRGYLELTLKGLFRIENIVQRLLSYAGKHTLNPQPVQVNKLIQDTLAMHNPKLQEKNIRVETDLRENMPDIEVDPFQLQQVFSNLILNAYDALPNSGQLTITSTIRNKQAFLSFIDNGPGIPEEIIDQVFDPFFTTKEVGKGTGLGLFISYNIIQILGGNIDIKSQSGKGTKIHIAIPLMPGGNHHE